MVKCRIQATDLSWFYPVRVWGSASVICVIDFWQTIRDQPGQTETSRWIASEKVQIPQALTKSVSILTITTSITTSLIELISHHEWFGSLHAGVGGDGQQAGALLGGVQQVQSLVGAEYGQSLRGRGPEDGCWHLETVGEEVAASDWSEMCHLSSDWSMSFVRSSQAVTMSCLKGNFFVKFNFYCVYNIITLLKLTQ